MPPLKKTLVDHADDILAAAKRHPHVKAVIRTIESAPGSLQVQSDCQVRYFGWCGVHVSIRNFLIVDLTRVTTQAALDLPVESPAIEQPGVRRNGQTPPHKSAILWHGGRSLTSCHVLGCSQSGLKGCGISRLRLHIAEDHLCN